MPLRNRSGAVYTSKAAGTYLRGTPVYGLAPGHEPLPIRRPAISSLAIHREVSWSPAPWSSAPGRPSSPYGPIQRGRLGRLGATPVAAPLAPVTTAYSPYTASAATAAIAPSPSPYASSSGAAPAYAAPMAAYAAPMAEPIPAYAVAPPLIPQGYPPQGYPYPYAPTPYGYPGVVTEGVASTTDSPQNVPVPAPIQSQPSSPSSTPVWPFALAALLLL